MEYSWPGNIRELKNTIERMAIIGGQILEESLLSFLSTDVTRKANPDLRSLKDFRNVSEREYILNLLKTVDGSISEAASVLQIERTYLHKKIHDYRILKKEYFS